MDARQRSLAETCVTAAEDGSMAFPAILAALAEAGFEGYLVDYRAGTASYYLTDGATHAVATPDRGPVAAAFDAAAVAAAVAEAQADGPGYTYPGFCRKVMAAGCAGYLVTLLGRRVVYFGRTGETHVEHFPR